MKSNLLSTDLVIWDDIGSTGMSNYDLSQLLMYIDQRILSGKSNIFTGNLMYSDLEKSLGSRLASRIWNTSSIAELKGKDKR
jgi:DNA replication protein DnaC